MGSWDKGRVQRHDGCGRKKYKEENLADMTEYSDLKEKMKDDKCGWSKFSRKSVLLAPGYLRGMFPSDAS
jgi:hypothetical protein